MKENTCRYVGIDCPARERSDCGWDALHFVCLYAMTRRLLRSLYGPESDKKKSLVTCAILAAIDTNPNITYRQIKKLLDIHDGGLSIVLVRLEKKGLISKTPTPGAARRNMFSLTREGERQLAVIYAELSQRMDYINTRLSAKAKFSLYRALASMDSVIKNLDNYYNNDVIPYGDAKYDIERPIRTNVMLSGKLLTSYSVIPFRVIKGVLGHREYGQTPWTVIIVLALIYTNPGITQLQIGRYLDLQRTSVSTYMKRVLEEGWVQGKPHESDKRRLRYSLTTKGETFFLDNMREMQSKVDVANILLPSTARYSLYKALVGMSYTIKSIDKIFLGENPYEGLEYEENKGLYMPENQDNYVLN